MAKLPKLLTVKQVSALLNLKPAQVYYIFNLEGFPLTRLGERVYVDEERLARWVNEHTLAN